MCLGSMDVGLRSGKDILNEIFVAGMFTHSAFNKNKNLNHTSKKKVHVSECGRHFAALLD